MKTVILKYNAGNVRSVAFALERLGVNPMISNQEEEIRSADKVIIPGVGEAGTAMTFLKAQRLDRLIVSLKQPVLGICLGMQLMCRNSEEGNTVCLGIFNQDVRKIQGAVKVPHMGWNNIGKIRGPLFEGLNGEEYMYYVHGYCAGIGADTIAVTEYGSEYSAALSKGNFYGVQFHPEKSGEDGARILENFLKL
ncbi:MAG TPA: imidazole glycerol phosphate synthase subunit HisH [Bacteroidia bacterium]|jgi:glutamine amidotransferase|nr:imidazole glycerol phosphate synthase subunit HisH [Bacteroidia bacterium]